MTPEERARQAIDRLLEAAGWLVQDRAAHNPFAGPGIALREAYLQTGYADYLLIVEGKALGVIEAKAVGATLSGVSHQSARYAVGLPAHIRGWLPDQPLPFRYESTGVETFFTNALDPDPRSRRVFAFHQPDTLKAWTQEAETLRARLQRMPPLDSTGLWPPRIAAITHLETSLAQGRPRALIQMATGAGKTFTTVNAVYRLIRYGGARRVLFLVDRNNLGRQALNEFQTFTTPDDGRKFTELYNVQRLQGNHIDDVSKVVITTIQRLYSILSGEEQYDAADEEGSLYETYEAGAPPPPRTVNYTPRVPLEFFDFIVVDECHRSIYSVWGQVLEYFDAFLIGLTATPSKLTLGAVCALFPKNESFFNKYMFYWLQSQRSNLVDLGAGGAQPNISQTIIKAYPFPLAPIDEQRRIVDEIEKQFTRLDAAVAALERVQANLARYKAAVLKAACEGRLVAQDAGDESAEILLQRISAERRRRWEADHPGKRYVEPKGVDSAELPDLPSGWVCASLNHIAEQRPGRCAVWEGQETFVIQKALHRIRPYLDISTRYLAFMLASDALGGRLETYFTGSTIKHFTGQAIRAYTVALPPLAEQQRIVAEVERRLSVVAAVESVVATNLARAARLRQSILQRAFTGRLVQGSTRTAIA